MAKKPTPLPITSPELHLLEQAREAVAESLLTIRACSGRANARLAELAAQDEYDDKLASHAAWLSKHLVSILGELRKLEAADRAAGAKMLPEEKDALVLAYLRDLPPERLQTLMKELSK